MGVIVGIELVWNTETDEASIRTPAAFKMLKNHLEQYDMLTAWLTLLMDKHKAAAYGVLADKLASATQPENFHDPGQRQAELQTRLQTAEEDGRDEGPDRAPEG